MADLYPASPSGVPADFTRPTAAYRRLTYASVAGLVLFAAGYLATIAWLGLEVWSYLSAALAPGGENRALSLVLTVPLLFLIAFLVKGCST